MPSHHRVSRLLSAMLIAMVIAVPALAQPSYPPRWSFGLNASLDYSLHRSFTPIPFGNTPTPVDAEELGFTAGLVGAMRLGEDPDGAAMLVHLGYQSLPVTFEVAARTANGRNRFDAPTEADGRHWADVGYGLLKGDLQLRLPVAELGRRGTKLYVNIGPSVGYVLNGVWKQAFIIDDSTGSVGVLPDSNYQELPAGRDVMVYEEDIRNMAQWRIGVRAGVTIGFRTETFYLAPTLSLDYALTPVVKGDQWKAHALQLGFDLQTRRSFWNWLLGE